MFIPPSFPPSPIHPPPILPPPQTNPNSPTTLASKNVSSSPLVLTGRRSACASMASSSTRRGRSSDAVQVPVQLCSGQTASTCLQLEGSEMDNGCLAGKRQRKRNLSRRVKSDRLCVAGGDGGYEEGRRMKGERGKGKGRDAQSPHPCLLSQPQTYISLHPRAETQ